MLKNYNQLSAVKHITILCSRLDLPGGIERVVVNTANLFASKNNKVTLLILDYTRNSFYPIHDAVQLIQQPLSFGITTRGNIITRKLKLLIDVLKLRRLLNDLQPSLVIASEYPFVTAAILCGAKKYAKVVSWEHHHFAWPEKNYFWTLLCNQTYPKLNGIVCLNKEEANHYEKIAPAFVVPNFVENTSGNNSTTTNKTILSVGWLIPRKGVDLLLRTAKEVLTIHSEWTWKLIGDGEMKEQVLQFIKTEKLEGRFLLQSPVGSNINNEYVNTSLFVLTSRYEAFPMVLLEAMSFGIPCISFDCPSGPADIIINKKNGLLIEKENTAKLTEAISLLITSEELRKEMGEFALQSVQQFSPGNVYQQWKEKIFTL